MMPEKTKSMHEALNIAEPGATKEKRDARLMSMSDE